MASPNGLNEEEATSGYHSEVGRSDTLDDLGKTSEISLDDDDDGDKNGLPPPAIEPEPVKNRLGDEDIRNDDEDDEEENPFSVHNPQLQLSATNGLSSISSSNVTSSTKNKPQQRSSVLDGLDEDKENDDFIEMKVINPQKIGDGINSYITYTVKTNTNINYFNKKNFEVSRRFSDFLGLHDKLSEKYLPNGRIIPPAPDKSMVGMAKVKWTKENDEASHDEFVEKRRASLERYLNRTASYQTLRTDPDFREFLTVESDLPRSNQTSALSGKNVMKLINKVGDKVSNLTLKMEETDEWFEEKTMMIDSLDHQLRKLHYCTECLVDYRRGLSHNTGGLSKSLSGLCSAEENRELSTVVGKLADVEERIADVHRRQSDSDLYVLSELVKDYVGLVGAVKDAFNERVKAWQNWQNITGSLTRKREAKIKAELQQRSDRVGVLRQEIAEYERQQELAQENFEKISRLIKKEVEFFDARKAADFKRAIVNYLERTLKAQNDIAHQWESYLPEIQQMDA